ncbi:MAG TPA: hypothetical protein DCE44_18135, partial [Verrucomicrobiales bacterium]|nr:hypothetical protein [Verrucomicrobiales bacterium]
MWTRTASWIVAWFIATGAVWAQGRTTVRLLTDSKEVLPGSSFVAAVELTAPPDWHTYWRNPGDSGQRTKVDWTLPDGVTASEILWPAPRRLTEAGLTTYVYDGRVSLPVRLTVAPSRAPGPLTLQARVSWLECKTECVPGRTNVSTSILVGSKAEPSSDAAAIAEELANLPELDPAVTASAEWMGSAIGDVRLLVVRSDTAGFRDFFPFERSDAEVARTNIAQAPPGIVFAVTKSGAEWPDRIEGLIQLAVAGNPVRSVVATVPIASATGTRPPTDADRTFSAPVATSRPTLVWMLGLAFLGGLILNIMPCVLPVIALKILGFVKQSREDPGRVRFLGVVYTVGVLVSFAVLAGLIIAVQSAGKTASWGMQFQNPVFLVAITTLVTLVALNLFGVFEVTMASGAMGAASQLASKEGASGAFFNGVFTTILATPCTAPFLGAALGFAFGQPALVLLLLFLTAGLGLAAPYLLLSLQPGWLKFLPKP